MQTPGAGPLPYIWVEIHEPDRRRISAWHDRLDPGRLTLRLTLRLHVVSAYLHVGSGMLGVDESRNPPITYYRFARRHGRIILPGSSLKGAVRSIAEALSASCVSQGALRRDPRPCRPIRPGTEDTGMLCPACQLFGATGYQGRILFGDAIPEGDPQIQIIKIPDLWRPRRSEGRKFYRNLAFQALDEHPEPSHRFLEAVPEGTVFRGRMDLENVIPEEIGLVLRALGIEVSAEGAIATAFPVKIGGGKPRCLGSVAVEIERLEVWNPRSLSWNAEELKNLAGWWHASARVRAEIWRTLRSELAARHGPCPRGNY